MSVPVLKETIISKFMRIMTEKKLVVLGMAAAGNASGLQGPYTQTRRASTRRRREDKKTLDKNFSCLPLLSRACAR